MFIAMNRFKVRPGREADFEDQWKTRETYLAGVPGFVAFALLRNQPVPGHGASAEAHGHEHAAHDTHDAHAHDAHEAHDHGHSHEAHGHQHADHAHQAQGHDAEPAHTEYVSHTTWRDQAAFDAWRNSDVFRLAHAQGSVEGVLLGPPVVALYASVMEEAGEPANA